MQPGLKDTAVIVAMVTVLGGVLSTFINAWFSRKESVVKNQYDNIRENLSDLINKVQSIDNTTVLINKQNDVIRDGTMKIQRYRLFNDLTEEISKGYTTLEHFRELSILFESYKLLGGNGEIEALYEKYKQLPIKEEKK